MINDMKIFENTTDRLNCVLDKLSKYGDKSLTKSEKMFLESYKDNNENSIHSNLLISEFDSIFVDDNEIFKFEYLGSTKNGKEWVHKGILYTPDLKIKKRTVNGILKGSIISYGNGLYSINFKSKKLDIFDFCNGIEYELDLFIEHIISKIEEKVKDRL